MPAGKHGPNNLSDYLAIHETAMARYRGQGFIVSDTLEVEDIGDGALRMKGQIKCEGGVRIDVDKILRIVGDGPLVQTVHYSYSAVLSGVGNIFRYCSPHPDDGAPWHPHHHVHRFDVLAGDEDGAIELVGDNEDWPTLSEVFEELRGWCADNSERLAAL